MYPTIASADYISNRDGAAVIAPIAASGSASERADASWIVRRGLADNACLSFESSNRPGDFLQQQTLALRVQPVDGSAVSRSGATFCPRPGRNGQGQSFQSASDPTLLIRHHNGKVYVASDGGSNPWDNNAHWSDDVSFVVGRPLDMLSQSR
jgi:non-reducing end alpha-L-arabinofuranosidase